MVNYIYAKDLINQQSLAGYVRLADIDFNPSIGGRVDIDLWTKKIILSGDVILAISEERIVGAIFFYANDIASKKAYISYLSVHRDFRSQGIARNLLARSFSLSKEKGMRKVGVHTHNDVALNLYKKIGFTVVEQVTTHKDGILKSYLERSL